MNERWIVRMEVWGCEPMYLAESTDPTRRATLADERKDAKVFRFVDALLAVEELHAQHTEWYGVEMLRLAEVAR